MVVERHLALTRALETVKVGEDFPRKEDLSSALKKGRISKQREVGKFDLCPNDNGPTTWTGQIPEGQQREMKVEKQVENLKVQPSAWVTGYVLGAGALVKGDNQCTKQHFWKMNFHM